MAGLAIHLVAMLAIGVAQGGTGINSDEGKWPDARRPSSSTDASKLDPTQEMLRIAQCIVDRSRTRATNLLSTEVGSSAEARVEGATRLSFEKCMVAGKVFTFNLLMFRGALAEVLYRSDVQGALSLSAATLSKRPLLFSIETPQIAALYAVAQCVTAQAPALVHSLMHVPPRSEEANRLTSALAPSLSACIPMDREFRADRVALRAVLAEAIYRQTFPDRAPVSRAAVVEVKQAGAGEVAK